MKDLQIIYGPPGTGKTTYLIDKVAEEIVNGIPLNRIAYMSFSKKATLEVQERIGKKFGVDVEREAPHIRTLHSMCFRTVNASARQMMDTKKYVDFGSKSGFNLKGFYNPEEGMSAKDDDFIMIEQLYRNNKRYCEKVLDQIDHKRFVYFMQMYEKYKRTFNFLDFTDLLDLYIEQDYQQDIDVAFIDEAQDLTSLQWKVAFKAFRKAKRVYIAGDDDQAIYQWNGADVDTFLRLRGEQTVLDYSYRLPQLFIDKAEGISSRILHRVNKIYSGADRKAQVLFVNSIDEVVVRPEETTYMLARNNYRLMGYTDYCVDRRLLFNYKGNPYITEKEMNALRTGGEVDADPDKIDYLNDVAYSALTQEPRINISTIHGVKGGEADHVVILSDVSRSCIKQLAIDEDSEHRCFYVALTRAKSRITIVLPTTKNSYPYLSEVPDEAGTRRFF